jgi:hydroxymethylpyrimidine/phosphomethylpyrimidine kinase
MSDARIPRVLTIAGSDSGGGAGIQADLKTFGALGVYGMSAITSVTAQNTRGVTGVHDLPPGFVAEQIDDVARDIGIDAAKTGMLSNAGIIEAVAASIARHRIEKLVVDPVMIAKSGDALLETKARSALIKHMAPLAYILTPNVPEAETIAGLPIRNEDDLVDIGRRIHDMGPRYVLMKGGHLSGSFATDYLVGHGTVAVFSAPRIETRNTHGTGCTYSAAIAAYLARGLEVEKAVAEAKEYVTGAIRHSLALGRGHGPLDHFWQAAQRRDADPG